MNDSGPIGRRLSATWSHNPVSFRIITGRLTACKQILRGRGVVRKDQVGSVEMVHCHHLMIAAGEERFVESASGSGYPVRGDNLLGPLAVLADLDPVSSQSLENLELLRGCRSGFLIGRRRYRGLRARRVQTVATGRSEGSGHRAISRRRATRAVQPVW
jgi:hypothetical protein